MLISSWLTHTDKAASLVYKSPDGCDNLLINPVLCTAECCVGISDIDDDTDVFRNSFSHIVKGNKFHIKRHTAQALQHTFLGISIPVVDRVMYLVGHPLSLSTPAV